MQASGKKSSQLWYTPEQYELVKRAAEVVERPMTKFAIIAVIKAAKRIIRIDDERKCRG